MFANFFQFLVILDPWGNAPMFLALTRTFSTQQQQWIALREMFFTYLLCLLFALFGPQTLQFLTMSGPSLKIGGALILALMAIEMVFAPLQERTTQAQDPFFVPIAVPMFAGPAILSQLMIAASDTFVETLLSFTASWLVCTLFLWCTPRFSQHLGSMRLWALERCAGLILLLLACSMLVDGFSEWYGALPL